MSNTFNMLGGTNANQIVSEIHFPINPKKNVKNLIWSGLIVAENSTQGSTAYADVVIFVDGVEKWRTKESITANNVPPIKYSINMSDAKYEAIIKTTCTTYDIGLALGFVNMSLKYKK